MTTENVIEVVKKKQTTRQIKEPGKFKVVVCNDDVTPVDFVIAMLIQIFKFDEARAVKLTVQVHEQGSGVAGIFPFEIAEQKSIDATNMARVNNFPLITKVEPE
jgi:ATP-dependent Clp protease adaptor protein ClpS